MSCDVVNACGAEASGYKFPERPAVETVRLRRATAEDAAMLSVVGSATFLEAYAWAMPGRDVAQFCLDQHTVELYARYLAKADTRITLAVTGEDAPVGYVMVCAPDFEGFEVGPEDIELKRIYRLSLYGAGRTGQRLMDAALADAREMGRKRVLLGTNAGNVRAIEFYRRNGFEEVGTRRFVVGMQQCCDAVFGKIL